jgi:hypothetical protein
MVPDTSDSINLLGGGGLLGEEHISPLGHSPTEQDRSSVGRKEVRAHAEPHPEAEAQTRA